MSAYTILTLPQTMFLEASSSELVTKVEASAPESLVKFGSLTDQIARQYTNDASRRYRSIAENLAAYTAQTPGRERNEDGNRDSARGISNEVRKLEVSLTQRHWHRWHSS